MGDEDLFNYTQCPIVLSNNLYKLKRFAFSMPTTYHIRTIQGRDLQALNETFEQVDHDYFEQIYLDHLQGGRCSWIAYAPVDKRRRYVGYISLVWESTYTPFWRRHIPEITDLFVHEGYRRQGIARQLIHTCEAAAKTAKRRYMGISVLQDDAATAHLTAMSIAMGYQPEGVSQSDELDYQHFMKAFD